MTYSKESAIFNIEYDPSGSSNSSFYAGPDNLNLLISYDFFYIFSCIVDTKTI